MQHQYNITHYRSLNGSTRIWTDRLFLSLLLFYTLTIAFYNSSTVSLVIVITSSVLLATAITLLIKRNKMPFVEIGSGTLRYFDAGKGEMVSVPLQDITQISTRFCELNLHTKENTHTLNLSLIRNAKTRWEIKEMIRQMARLAA